MNHNARDSNRPYSNNYNKQNSRFGKYSKKTNNGSHSNQSNNSYHSRHSHHSEHSHHFSHMNGTNTNGVNDTVHITSNRVKKFIIEYVYKKVDLSNYKYKLLEYESDLPLLDGKDYMISPNYSGSNGLLVFLKMGEEFLSVLIDKKTLNYNIEQINYSRVKISRVSLCLDTDIYKGTIADGILLYQSPLNLKQFVVNDIYYFLGKNFINDKISNKMMHLNTYMDIFNKKNQLNNISLIPNQFFEMACIKSVVNYGKNKFSHNSSRSNHEQENKEIHIKYSKAIRGVSFYPPHSGTKLIYLYNNVSTHTTDFNSNSGSGSNGGNGGNTKTPSKVNLEDSNNSETNMYKGQHQTKQSDKIRIDQKYDKMVFRIKNTDIPDVYNLYIGTTENHSGKKIIRYKKVDIAYIPTRECSMFCKNLLSDASKKFIFVRCQLDKDKNKWVPVEEVGNTSVPDIVDKDGHLVASE